MAKPIKYIGKLSQVREVSILATADLNYWKERLRPHNLVPAGHDGHCHVLIVAGDARFAGLRFREVSFSVLLTAQGMQPWHHAAYLLHAFNSSCFFAWCERVCFSTPYAYAQVRVNLSPPCIEVVSQGRVIFRAQLEGQAPARDGDTETGRFLEGGWDGPVFLPKPSRSNGKPMHVFFSRIRGYAERYAFLDSRDLLRIAPTAQSSVLQALLDSRLSPVECLIRRDAFHAKSKTYRRDEIFPGGVATHLI